MREEFWKPCCIGDITHLFLFYGGQITDIHRYRSSIRVGVFSLRLIAKRFGSEEDKSLRYQRFKRIETDNE